MSNFNENPFLKDTPVSPFSNRTTAVDWMINNCDCCSKHETKSTKETDAKCKLSFRMCLGFATGKIPLWVAKEIGCKYNPLYQTVDLDKRCNCFDDGNESKPF
jgi:hypothetical protein